MRSALEIPEADLVSSSTTVRRASLKERRSDRPKPLTAHPTNHGPEYGPRAALNGASEMPPLRRRSCNSPIWTPNAHKPPLEADDRASIPSSSSNPSMEPRHGRQGYGCPLRLQCRRLASPS